MKVLMNQLAKLSPLVAVAHDQKMVSTGDEMMRDIRCWSIAVDRTFLINHGLDQTAICDHDSCGRAQFEGKDATVLLCPFCESIE